MGLLHMENLMTIPPFFHGEWGNRDFIAPTYPNAAQINLIDIQFLKMTMTVKLILTVYRYPKRHGICSSRRNFKSNG